MTETDTRNLITRFLNNLEERAENISDTRLVSIVLAFVAGGLFVSAMAAVLHSIGEGAASWDWLPGVKALFEWLDGFAQNFSTEMIGAVITFVLLEVLLARRRTIEAEDREKERLILQMGSPFNESAVEAVRQLEARGWLKDGSLKNANLKGANLEGTDLYHADLNGANLRETDLSHADLYKADLRGANLQEADLELAKLQWANLSGANLHGANLWCANLYGANLEGANLHGACLVGANLRAVDLVDANLQRANLMEAKLQEADLSGAWLQEANLLDTKLQGARNLTCDQLSEAELLLATMPDGKEFPTDVAIREHIESGISWFIGASHISSSIKYDMPDGTRLSVGDIVKNDFQTWCQMVKVDEYGNIVSSPPDDDAE